MKVKDLIKNLQNMPPNAEVVYIYYDSGDGCETCGYNDAAREGEICSVISVDENKTVRLTGY